MGYSNFNVCKSYSNYVDFKSLKVSNYFIKKVWGTRKIFCFQGSNFQKTFGSIHSFIKFVKSWDVNVCFFVTGKVICPFSQRNLNHLRNIFIKVFAEEKLWFEIEKMFNLGILNMSQSSIYWGGNISSFSLLSRFLLELYLSELDNYIGGVLLKTKYFFTLSDKVKLKEMFFSNLLLSSLPIKLEKNLKLYSKLSIVNNLRFNHFFSHFISTNFVSGSRVFQRNFYWVRYVNFILFGFITSKNYSYFLFEKVLSFLRSNLLCDLKDIFFSLSSEKNFCFMGFTLLLKEKFINYKFSKKFNDNNIKKLQARINLYRKKLLNLISNRFSSELYLHFVSFLEKKKVVSRSFSLAKIWTYIFQFECVRSLQLGKLLFSRDRVSSLDHLHFSQVRKKSLISYVFYRRYSFNLYLRKLHFIFRNLISKFDSYYNYSVMPFDMMLYKFTISFQKKIFFLYENLYVDFICPPSFVNVETKASFNSVKVFQILVPSDFILKKLRTWGFIHPYKNRPISNSKFLFKHDSQIIRDFSYVSNQIIFWFRCVDNFSSVKFLIEIIRQSCFLTLCRKHNKSRVWSYGVYTPNLLFGRNLDFSNMVFPDRKFLFKLRKKFLLNNNMFSFNEKFFLIN